MQLIAIDHPTEERTESREQLRLLDACLYELENANERDEIRVSPELAARLRLHVPSVVPRMLISEALDCVFQQQERYLLCDEHDDDPDDEAGEEAVRLPLRARLGCVWTDTCRPADPLDEPSARTLTELIRQASSQVCILLLEAHERRAYTALGYPTWEQYVRREFSLSRSRSYELLDQGRVILAVQVAAGLEVMPDISAYAVAQIKPHLDDVLDAVRVRARGIEGDEALAVVSNVVSEWRARVAPRRPPACEPWLAAGGSAPRVIDGGRVDYPRRPWGPDLPSLYGVVERLAAMPPASQLAPAVPECDADRLRDLETATGWLNDFTSAWRRRSASAARRLLTGVAEDVERRPA
jgi:hypothetical protein